MVRVQGAAGSRLSVGAVPERQRREGAGAPERHLVKHHKRSRRSPPYADPFAAVHAPNDCWAIDFKGWARAGDGTRVDPLTLIDADSLFLAYVLPSSSAPFQEGKPRARQLAEAATPA